MTATYPGGAEDPSLPRRLLIMRHAKSDRNAYTERDIDRPLNARGQRDAPRMGAWLRSVGLIPDFVACSPAVRTRQTLDAIVRELSLSPETVRIELDLYEASLPRLYAVLRTAVPDSRVVLLLGHNPGVTELLLSLAGHSLAKIVADPIMPTAAIACLAMPEDWLTLRANSARLLHWMTPKSLPQMSA